MQEIYRRQPMPNYDFNKFALKLYWNRTSAWVLSCKFSAYFQNTFSSENFWTTASDISLLVNFLIKTCLSVA